MKNEALYSERVIPRLSSFLPLALLLPVGWLTTAMFAPLIGLGVGVIIALVSAAFMLHFSPVIEIDEKYFALGSARIPISKLGKARVITGKDVFQERGPKLDARAFVQFQSSVKQMVKVEIRDSVDPTPYWLFSTRNAEEVVRLLSKKRSN
ncbi:MAG: DUF3093 domain-containing protein [Rhodoluna sp.]